MNKTVLRTSLLPLIIIFIIINTLCIVFKTQLAAKKIDAVVVEGANVLMFLLSVVGMFLHYKSMQHKNPQVFVRSVMGVTALKFFIIAVAALLYLYLAGSNRNVYGVIAGMALYFIYTIVDVKTLLKLNRS